MNTKLKCVSVDAYDQPFHYFASSVGEWRTDRDLEGLISFFKKSGLDFTIMRVLLPAESSYGIRNFRPDLPDTKLELVGHWTK